MSTLVKAIRNQFPVFNVKDYGAVGNGTTNDSAAIQSAITAANVAGGGTVYLPIGTYKLSTNLLIANNVNILGAGVEKSILLPQVQQPAIKYTSGSTSVPLTNCTFSNFSIDGSQQSGSYSAFAKGIWIQYQVRCVYRDLYIHDTEASGLGIDFLQNCLLENVTATNCGRLGTITSAGAAGIGIGVTSWDSQNTITGCVTNNNKRCGLFFETQDGTYGKGYQVIGHSSSGNGDHGIADAGCDGLEIIGGRSTSNTKSGFSAYSGTIGAKPGINGRVVGLEVDNNTENGIFYDPVAHNGVGAYTFSNIKSHDNTKFGFKFDVNATGGNHIIDMTVTDSDIYSNGQAGIIFNSSASSWFKRPYIVDNRIRNNGTAGTFQAGIYIQNSIVDGRIAGNRCWDDTSGTQLYGFNFHSGTYSGNLVIEDNDLRGNATGAITSLATIDSSVITINSDGTNNTGRAALGAVNIAGDTMTGDLIVPDEAYGSAWNGSLEVPTKNAVYDKIQTLSYALFSYIADAGNVTTGETDLYTDSIPANTLATNKDKLEARYAGIFVSSGTATRQLKCYFAGTVIFDSGALSISLSASWSMSVMIIRVSSTVIRALVELNTTGASAGVYANVQEVTGLTLSNANILKITGQASGVGAATNDIVAKLGNVIWESSP